MAFSPRRGRSLAPSHDPGRRGAGVLNTEPAAEPPQDVEDWLKHFCRFSCLAKNVVGFAFGKGRFPAIFEWCSRPATDDPFRPAGTHHLTPPRAWPTVCSPPAAENEQASGERIGAQFFAAQLRQSINAFPQVDGLDGYQNAHLRRDLNHADSHSTRLSPARSGVMYPFHWTRILPRGRSNSMTHSALPPVPGVSNSTNAAGGTGVRRHPDAAATVFAAGSDGRRGHLPHYLYPVGIRPTAVDAPRSRPMSEPARILKPTCRCQRRNTP